MHNSTSTMRWRKYAILTGAVGTTLLFHVPPAPAQTRVTGLDVSAWQGSLSQGNWNTIHNTDGRAFAFIRSSRGGTSGYYNQNNAGNDNPPGQNSLSQRYDDPYFVQNINNATAAGMFAGPYHFGRMDIIASTLNANGIPNNGTDEANHFIQMAGAWMRPGYLLPVFDFEAGSGARSPSELAQFAIDFSDRIFAVKGIRPAVYIGTNYASPMNAIPESAAVVAAYPTLWNARWPNQSNPNAIDIQGTDPGDSSSAIYGPWDNPPNSADPWHFWQYASTAKLQGIGNGTENVDVDVAHGGIEYLKDHLVPALWLNNTSGDWTALANWNSGVAPVAPVTGPGQVPPSANTLPTTRLPGANDTVVLDRTAANITVTLASGTQNIRKLYVREALNITGGTLNIGYIPSADSTSFAAQFSDAVTLSGNANLSVHTLRVDATRTFTLAGGALTFNTISLIPDNSSPAKIAVTGDVTFNPLSNATATIAKGSGVGSSGVVDLGGANRVFNVGNGTADVDLAVNVPITNGGLTKIGAGTLALNGANTYTGNTLIQAGSLILGTASLADAADVYLSAGTTLDLNFGGNADYVHGLFFNGVGQANGIWGAIGSGAPFTSSLLTGTGRLNVAAVPPPPPPPPPPGHIIDDFEVNEGHFNWAYNLSPVSQTFGLATTTAIDRVTTEHQGTGVGSQLLNLVIDSPTDANGSNWQIRHNSGIGSAAQPAGNEPLDATGYVGFWLKTDDAGITVRIGIDDPVGGNTALERGYAQTVIPDNQWHLYQWNFEDGNHWDAFAGGANGTIDAPNGLVTIDSIWFAGAGNAQIYLDNVSHNPLGLLAAAGVLGDYNGDGAVDAADYVAWRNSFGDSVTPGTKADGDRDGVITMGDFVVWRMQMSQAGQPGAGTGAAAVPEPTTCLLLALGTIGILTIRKTISPLAA